MSPPPDYEEVPSDTLFSARPPRGRGATSAATQRILQIFFFGLTLGILLEALAVHFGIVSP